MKLGKHDECKDLLIDIKPAMQKDQIVIKYFVHIFNAFSMNDKCTELLENNQNANLQNEYLS